MRKRFAIIGALSVLLMSGAVVAQAATSQYGVVDTNVSAAVTTVLNSSVNAQSKSGSLLIGYPGKGSQLCLNPVASSTIDSANANCISSWSDPRLVSGNHVRLYGDLLPFFDQVGGLITTALLPSSYQRDDGYAAIKANGQSFSTIIRAPVLNICDFTGNSNPQDPGRCWGSQVQLCFTNSDCGYVGTAVYATGSSGGGGRAGYFTGGTVLISSVPTNERYNQPINYGRICLGTAIESPYNDQVGGACISSWNEVSSTTSAAYIRLQSTNNPAPQAGGGVISGTAQFGAAVVGDLTGVNTTRTCGDGICTAGETSGGCAVDCAGVATVTSLSASVNVASSLSSPQVTVATTIGSQSPVGSSVRLIVVRSTSSTATWKPVNGVIYATGTINSANTIIRSSSETQGANVQFTDTLPNQTSTQTQYYYYAYQGNTYPIYGAQQASTVTVKVALLTTTANYSNVVTLKKSSGALLSCAGSTCTGLFNNGVTDTVSIESITSGYAISSWTGCTTWDTTSCTLTMNGATNVTITLQSGGGGGGGGGGSEYDL